MNGVVEQALALWGMSGAAYKLVAARENAVFRVTTDTETLALRLHRQGYRTDAELWSELKWMDAVAKGGITVPQPIPSLSGDVLHVIDNVQVDVLTWLSGVPLTETLETHSMPERAQLFHNVGREMARLHLTSDAWVVPEGFSRCSWDRDGLLGEEPLWDQFWNNPKLSAEDRHLFLALRDKARIDLKELETTLDYGLIHADLVSANVMVDGDQISLIDFDDGGYGFRLFDIATALLKSVDNPDYSQLRAGLIKGYTSVREIDLAALDLFMMIRAATYVGWNIKRMAEDGAELRNARFISTTRQLSQLYLSSLPDTDQST